MKGEAEIPEFVKMIYHTKCLTIRRNREGEEHEKKKRRILSLAQDAMFVTTYGLCKTPKHLLLRLVLKSMTGSSKTIEILFRYALLVLEKILIGI